MGKTVHFTVEGDLITQLAREKFFMQKDLGAALRLLKSATVTDQLSEEEHIMLCLQILNGDAWITGTSGDSSYGVEFRDDMDENPTDLGNIAQLILDIKERADIMEEECHMLRLKFSMVCERMSEYELDRLNADWYDSYGDPMFEEQKIPSWMIDEDQDSDPLNNMLGSFLEQCRREQKAEEEGCPVCDYGWLSPDGEFFPVDFAEHGKWAQEWLDDNMPFKDHPEIYYMTDDNGTRHHITCGDVLIYSLGWVLLNSPYRGKAKATHDPKRDYTKAQKDFLYGYYIERGRMEEAASLFED